MANQSVNRDGEGEVRTRAVVFERPQAVALRQLELTPPEPDQVLVDVEWSGISTGTEKLLWSGRMPPFPGMGYPLVPGYETVGRVAASGETADVVPGQRVFVSGARCYGEVRGLFGGAASRLVADRSKLVPIGEKLGEDAILFALAATAYHALVPDERSRLPELVVGHGVLGRLLARLTIALGGRAPTVWETNPKRAAGAVGYDVIDPASDTRKDYGCIVDASGDASLLDVLIQHLARRGEIVLAGFYAEPLSFTFPPAFIREASIRIAAEWAGDDLQRVKSLVDGGALSLAGLISHRAPAAEAERAYQSAFSDPDCLKMVLDWRSA